MVEIRHLPNAPITEAVIDLRVKFESPLDLNTLLEFTESLSGEFPHSERQYLFQAQLYPAKKEVPTKELKTERGFILKSADKKEIVQFRIDGFTFSRLKPYTSWADVFPKAWRLWKRYKNTVKPMSATRLATRFINRLEIKKHSTDLGDYLTSPPVVPNGVPNLLNGFLTRLVVRDSDKKISVNIVQASEQSISPDTGTILLDIDAYREGAFEEDQLMERIFNDLRYMKNLVFFSSLTEKAVRLFE